MTTEAAREAVLAIIQDISGKESLPPVDGAVSLRDQLSLDSMDFLDIVMELRKRYKVEVPEADYRELATLDSAVAYLQPRLP